MVELLKPDTIVHYNTESEDIFEPYKEKDIEIITLNYWRNAFGKVAD